MITFTISFVASLLPTALSIYLCTTVSKFYEEIGDCEENDITFPTKNMTPKLMRKFMTDDEYALSKRHLKVNARACRENRMMATTAIKIKEFIDESKLDYV